MSKLRLIYLLGKGGQVAVGDKVMLNDGTVEVTSLNVHSINRITLDSHLITIEKFGFRGEIGVKELSPDFPVDADMGLVSADKADWDKIVCWKPCIKTLIKMQTFDEDLAEDEASENLLNAVHEQSLLDIASEEMAAEIEKSNKKSLQNVPLEITGKTLQYMFSDGMRETKYGCARRCRERAAFESMAERLNNQ
jgi:hypothetical protein